LSKTVGEIQYSKNEDGTYNVSVTGLASGYVLMDKDGMSLTDIENNLGKDIAEKINNNVGNKNGSDLNGKQLMSLRGEGLKVGGKGMKGFYGSPTEGSLGIVGNVAKSLFKQEPKTVKIKTDDKKWEFEVDTNDDGTYNVTIKGDAIYGADAAEGFKTRQDARSFAIKEIASFENQKETTTQHSIDITPELKTEVGKGLPLFGGLNKIGENTLGSAIASAKALDQAFKAGIDLSESVEDNIQEMEDKGIIEKDCN
jgi:hypothetical protein